MSLVIKKEITSVEVKVESPEPQPMDDETDALLDEVCSNTLREIKKESIEESATEVKTFQEDGKRKLDAAMDLPFEIKTENNTNEASGDLAGNGKWCDDGEDYPSMPKKIRENHNDAPGEMEQRPRRNSGSSNSTTSSGYHNQNQRKQIEYETKPDLLARRQKDIDYGKNTIGYDRYIQQVPKDKRTKDHPRTPPMHLKYTRRGWDGMVKLWRKQLHIWDPPKENSEVDGHKEEESDNESGEFSP